MSDYKSSGYRPLHEFALFIGGPLDKQWHPIDMDLNVVVVPEIEERTWEVDEEIPKYVPFKRVQYVRNAIQHMGLKTTVFTVKDAKLPPVAEVTPLIDEWFKR